MRRPAYIVARQHPLAQASRICRESNNKTPSLRDTSLPQFVARPTVASRDLDLDLAITEMGRLTVPSVLGFYTHFEATEIFAIRDGETVPTNVFSILVAAENLRTASDEAKYLGQRIKLKLLKGWTFGIRRYVKPISELVLALRLLREDGAWQPSGKELRVSDLQPVATQFVPPDSTVLAPWNQVLKNNFWSGSYVIELADTKKTALKPFFDDPPALQELSKAVQQSVPIRLASLSDRLGNIVVQLPVTVIIATFGRNRLSGDAVVSLRWHPNATPRDLRVSCDTQFDNVISGYTAAHIHALETVLTMQNGEGMLRGVIWDEEHRVILAASGSTGFIKRFVVQLRPIDPEPRVFYLTDKNENKQEVRVGLTHTTKSVVGDANGGANREWTQRRIYRDEEALLKAERNFVQYLPEPGQQRTKHDEALRDVRHLLNQYGQDGAWLWDPYLSADDILNTLFFCSHSNAELRALTAASEAPTPACSEPNGPLAVEPIFAERQRAVLTGAKSNLRGLRLEYRMKIGQAGWAFHDRFLIFPNIESGALAWSLGTSVNSLGRQHHILQRVGDGQLVADAFNELWDQLDQPDHLVWKAP